MSLITFKVKVKQMAEEEMELLQGRDLGNLTPKTEKWVWKERTLRESHIASITRYNTTKCIIELTYGGYLLVAEPFTDAETKWRDAYEGFDPEEEEETEENLNLGGEKDSEDDDR